MTEGLEFDPGFAPHILAFQGTIEYLYNDINKFKNFSQKKMRFRQYYKKILDVFYNNLGFYAGCLMWALYISKQDKQPILNNHCFGQDYDEEANTAETDYMIQFANLFPKDMNYFIGEKFAFDSKVSKIMDLYREFLIINKGFVDSKENTDIKLPKDLKTVSAENCKKYIDEAVTNGNLTALIEYIE